MAEEDSPWANIIVRLEDQPQVEFDIVPIISSAMCPTDE